MDRFSFIRAKASVEKIVDGYSKNMTDEEIVSCLLFSRYCDALAQREYRELA